MEKRRRRSFTREYKAGASHAEDRREQLGDCGRPSGRADEWTAPASSRDASTPAKALRPLGARNPRRPPKATLDGRKPPDESGRSRPAPPGDSPSTTVTCREERMVAVAGLEPATYGL